MPENVKMSIYGAKFLKNIQELGKNITQNSNYQDAITDFNQIHIQQLLMARFLISIFVRMAICILLDIGANIS